MIERRDRPQGYLEAEGLGAWERPRDERHREQLE